MNIKKMVECLNQNDINCDAKFRYLDKEGCPNGYQAVYNDAKATLENCLNYGVNNGFANGLRDDIEDLTKVMANISGEENTKKLNKYIGELDKIRKDANKYMKEGVDKTMVNNLEERLSICKTAAAVLQRNAVDQSRSYIHDESIAILKEMEKATADIVDTSTSGALTHAENIVNNLNQWSKEVVADMHGSLTNTYLENALNELKTWSTLVKAKAKFDKVAPESVAKLKMSATDDLVLIRDSEIHLENAKNCKSNIEAYSTRVTEQYDLGGVENEITAKTNELDMLKKRAAENMDKFNNGEIDEETAAEIDEEIENAMQDVDDELYDLKLTRDDYKDAINSYSGIINKLNGFIKDILVYEKEPAMLTLACQGIDFQSLNSVLRGVGNSEAINNVLDAIDKISQINLIKIKQRREAINKIKEEQERFRQVKRDTIKDTTRVREREDRDKNREDRLAKFRQKAGIQNEQQQDKVKEKQETVANEPLSILDITDK